VSLVVLVCARHSFYPALDLLGGLSAPLTHVLYSQTHVFKGQIRKSVCLLCVCVCVCLVCVCICLHESQGRGQFTQNKMYKVDYQ